jgi:transcriptional enhancer factor
MGRRKFSMVGKLHGRNMLISEYIFVICVALLGSKEIFRIDNSNDSIEQMGRKQVSSHMQVVKKFFEDLRCCKCYPCLLCLISVFNGLGVTTGSTLLTRP